MILSHIVACSENRVIGAAGGLPWHIPEDFKFFKQTTMGHAMIMGRKTFDSIGKPLPGRLTVVVTRQANFAAEGVQVCHSIEEAIELCEKAEDKWGDEIFLIGGGELFHATLPLANRVYLTLIHKAIAGDTYYPELPQESFKLIRREDHLDKPLPFSFLTYERI